MGLPLPTSLTPSKVASFTDCALAFRYSVIDGLPEPPSPHALRGTLVHRALQLLHWEIPAGERDIESGGRCLDRAWAELTNDAEFQSLGLDPGGLAAFRDEAAALVRGCFALEDPNAVRAIGVELLLEADLGPMRLRGVIDRLELDPAGDLVITDYKTGRAPHPNDERHRLEGVQFYAFLCEQVLGVRPRRVQLLYLAEPLVISTEPDERSLGALRRRAEAIWAAVEHACENEDFRPRPSALCDWCAFKPFCPAFGGDPTLATAEARAGAVPVLASPR